MLAKYVSLAVCGIALYAFAYTSGHSDGRAEAIRASERTNSAARTEAASILRQAETKVARAERLDEQRQQVLASAHSTTAEYPDYQSLNSYSESRTQRESRSQSVTQANAYYQQNNQTRNYYISVPSSGSRSGTQTSPTRTIHLRPRNVPGRN